MSIKFYAKNIFQDDIYSYIHHADDISLIIHNHDFYEIFIILSGCVEHELNGTTKNLKAKTAFLLNPEEKHSYKNPSGDFVMLNIAVRQNTFHSLIDYLNITIKRECRISNADCEKLIKKFEQTASISKNMLLKITQSFADSTDTSNIPQWLSDIYRKLKEDCNFVDGINYIEKTSGKSLPHVSREFKKYYGCTPIEYITDLRINFATQLLKSTALSITEIAFRCGYFNISHFNHVFKRKTSFSPLAFKEKNAFYP